MTFTEMERIVNETHLSQKWLDSHMQCFQHVLFKISITHPSRIVNKQLDIGIWTSRRMLVYIAIGSLQYRDYTEKYITEKGRELRTKPKGKSKLAISQIRRYH